MGIGIREVPQLPAGIANGNCVPLVRIFA
jgi:hypothetical protein